MLDKKMLESRGVIRFSSLYTQIPKEFAYDTGITVRYRNPDVISQRLQEAANKMNDCCIKWKRKT